MGPCRKAAVVGGSLCWHRHQPATRAPVIDEPKAPAQERVGRSVPAATRIGSRQCCLARPPWRSCMANRIGLERLAPRCRRTPHQAAAATRRVPGGAGRRGVSRPLQGAEKPLLHRRFTQPDADLRLDRCVDRRAERLRRGGRHHTGHRRGGEFRARQPPAAGREGRRPQLPGHLERARLAAGLDARVERNRAPRWVRRPRLRRTRRAATGGHDRRRRDLDACLQRSDHRRRPLRSGRRLRHRRRCRPGTRRRVRQLLENLQHRRRIVARSRNRHRRWRRAERQRLHAP